MVDGIFRRLRPIYEHGLGGRTGEAARGGASWILAQTARTSELRLVVAAAGDGQDSRCAAADNSGDARSQLVGSGRYLRRAGGLQGDQVERQRQRQSFPGDGTVASRSGN